MNKYTPSEIEKKWQDFWDEHESFVCENNSDKEKFYALVEFPYPSGQGLHVGHPRPYTALDIVSRMKRMQGYNVLYPMGWDAFGLPTENYAIKNKIHPALVTKNNIAHFKKQLKSIGLDYRSSLLIGQDIHLGPPRPLESSELVIVKTLMPFLSSRSFET